MDGLNAFPDAQTAEMSLNVLAYNMKRVMNIIGTASLLKAMAA